MGHCPDQNSLLLKHTEGANGAGSDGDASLDADDDMRDVLAHSGGDLPKTLISRSASEIHSHEFSTIPAS